MSETVSRYHRQMLLPGFGEGGQRRLADATALVLGCGALGTVIADTLARAGVGRLVLVDRDLIDTTNLQRQVLYDEQDIADALPKAEAARRRLARVNGEVSVTAVVDDLDHTNIARHAAGADVIVDGLDNFEARYLANDYAVRNGIPYIYGGAVGTSGTAYTILPHTPRGDAPWERGRPESRATPCLRCLFEDLPPAGSLPSCDTAGVLAPVAAMIASFEAGEALKVLTGNFDRVCPSLLTIDLWANTFRQLDVARAWEDGDCPCCKHGRFEFLDGSVASGATVLCGADAVQLRPGGGSAIDLEALAGRLRRHGRVAASAYMVRADITDNARPYQLTVFPDGRAIVKGTHEAHVARGLYARYVGV